MDLFQVNFNNYLVLKSTIPSKLRVEIHKNISITFTEILNIIKEQSDKEIKISLTTLCYPELIGLGRDNYPLEARQLFSLTENISLADRLLLIIKFLKGMGNDSFLSLITLAQTFSNSFAKVNGMDELIDILIMTYPTRTPLGRILSPKNVNTIKSGIVRKKCKTLFTGAKALVEMNNAITALNDEVAYRKKHGELDYMVGIEVWLNQGKYEDEYKTPETKKPVNFGFGRIV